MLRVCYEMSGPDRGSFGTRNVALVRRGTCFFQTKCANAQEVSTAKHSVLRTRYEMSGTDGGYAATRLARLRAWS
eukprot:3260292-Rhodomonas_salina.2